MLNKLKKVFTAYELLRGNYGIERESLRVNKDGEISLNSHPTVFGDKIKNPSITTDFSESQIEVITPPFKKVEEVFSFTNALYDIVSMEIGDEYLWPQSMPSIVPEDSKIPIAEYEDDNQGKDARIYREKLIKKYGGKKQLICGIHYNFSFSEEFIEKLYRNEIFKSEFLHNKCIDQDEKDLEYKTFKNNIYLKVSRNYLRYRWLIIYLMGASGIVHESYKCGCKSSVEEIAKSSFTNEGALSYRNSECGYKNKVDLFPSYNSVEEYVESLKKFINDEVINSHKELYSSVRLKPADVKDFSDSLLKDGIKYLEYRSIDINPFEKGGISLEDLYFLQVFNLFLLIDEESDYERWQEDATENQNIISKFGQKSVMLKKDGKSISKEEWALEILQNIKRINNELNLEKEDIIDTMIKKVNNYKLTYAYRIEKIVKEQGYINAHLNLAKKYKENAYNNRFKLEGYEELELSTQILMKEAIKRGISVEVVDKAENFICLKKDDKVEYVKQATKTSKDNYITILIMENKSVTKKILKDNNIIVPNGIEVNSLYEVSNIIKDFVHKPIVIKPKSTNFGTGISIFSEGADEDSIIQAFKIAFKYDNTVLIEEFIKGKEYRFLVTDDKVAGILCRIPANVKGDGKKTIKELVEIKNQDSLRGYHYVTPLEKINLDENAALFLKQQNKDFNYIPKKDEIVYLRENSNISTGGDSIDYTECIPEKFKEIAVKSARAAGAKICGVDMILENYRDENTNYAIIELNFNPAIHIHCYPFKGTERKIGEDVLRVLGFI
ncbi:bifunctional glutamate--cysteine ligase GshA/glutathione synthetase GshB [Clostridium saccharobutylicum]|uniref:Glutathione biosynthesis bifunctional protein GshAB n=1 Tax=Clostridium saccharobutylicum DSM 13864 TaxID=1345695 RepID=U5MPI0_CLOSA|nr:bifunctional glutamate--cysteine ligase GshA/glutathione synthetase GshB [Clostridium saccharobutylicum]AGX42475.1 gshAB: glutathione biosynthesis bifunctional protein GshAB [Clostridium saccharobutylicum DSM 13864]AQR89760.1 glutathione biosynthesis bifunctional protein GshAB [Clostridium saccharobutylicum]AQR99662.1 glutathione biosynthesis bifunctional protein GshAB [Clostridium saccharobutylicum]AQS09393.1 glutathione biosynthesis bifunctional protein GshAB [Clostridium saccharobutylicum